MELLDHLRQFEAMVAARPDHTLVVDRDGERRTSMKAFWTMCLQLAAAIRRRQNPAGVGGFLPIVLSDGPEYFAAELAVWMTGNAAVNLGHSFPKERVAFIREQCEAEFLLDEDFVAKALSAGLERRGIDTDANGTAKGCGPDTARIDSAGAVYAPRRPEQPCLMFYTSGSTGNPKGVLHSDEGICQCLQRIPSNGCLEPCRQYFMLSPCYFVAISLPLSLLLGGKTLHIPGSALRRDALRLVDYLNRWEIDYAYLTPSLLGSLKADLPHLRCVLSAGERMINLYSENYTLINLYGQTETFGLVCRKIVDKAYDNTPVGSASPQLDVCLLDENDREVEPGAIGEFCIKGGLVPPVYFKDPERTAQLVRGGRLHTGDLMRQLPNGDFLYLQRKDWMLKINGQRVEPGEVEAVFLRVEGLKNALVKGFTTPDGTRQYMVGYYIADGSREITPAYLTEALSRKLPTYMLPTHFVAMDAFPLNANGKIDRQSLTPPVVATQQADYVAPETELQQALCETCAKVLGVRRIGLDDDFFHLGGDSIRSMTWQQVFNSDYAAKGWAALSTEAILSGRTPRAIASLIENEQTPEFSEQEDYPLCTSQQTYVYSSLSMPDKPFGLLTKAVRLDKGIDLERLARALERVVKAHAAFGLRLEMGANGEVRQKIVHGEYSVCVEHLDAATFERAKTEMNTPFQVLDSPLYAFRLIECEGQSYLLGRFHHSAFDGVSLDVFTRDLSLAYEGLPLPEETWNQCHIAQLEHRFRQSERHAPALAWFKEHLDNIPDSSYPLPDLSPTEAHSTHRAITLGVSPQVIKAQAARLGVTLNVYTATVFARLMGDYSHQRHICLMMVYDSRSDSRLENTIGQIANPYLLNTAWEESEPLTAHLKAVSDYLITATSMIKADTKALRSHTGFVPFLFQGEKREWLIGGNKAEDISLPHQALGMARFIVHLSLEYSQTCPEGAAVAQVFYRDDLYSEAYIRRIMDDFSQGLQSAEI